MLPRRALTVDAHCGLDGESTHTLLKSEVRTRVCVAARTGITVDNVSVICRSQCELYHGPPCDEAVVARRGSSTSGDEDRVVVRLFYFQPSPMFETVRVRRVCFSVYGCGHGRAAGLQ